MNILLQLRQLHQLEHVLSKFAHSQPIAEIGNTKLAIWNKIKKASYRNPVDDLIKFAKELIVEASIHNTQKVAFDKNASAVHIASLVSAYVVDQAIEKTAHTDSEKDFLHQLNAESAIDDLYAIVKTANHEWLTHPGTLAGAGALLGGGLGAWSDEENRLRGALVGGTGGAAVGGLAGLGLQHIDQEVLHNLAEAAAKNKTPSTPKP